MLNLPKFPAIYSPDLPVEDGEYNITDCEGNRLVDVKICIENSGSIIYFKNSKGRIPDKELEEYFTPPELSDSDYFISKDDDIGEFYSWAFTQYFE